MPTSKHREPRSPKPARQPAKTTGSATKTLPPAPFSLHNPPDAIPELAQMRGNEREINLSVLSSRNYKVGTREERAKLTIPALQCYIPSAKHVGAIVAAPFSQWGDRVSNAAQQGVFPRNTPESLTATPPITNRDGVILCPWRQAPRPAMREIAGF